MSINKIKKSKDFSLIYNKSQKMHTKYAIIFIKENLNNEQRFGFVASKKTGNAVQRNRIKRIFKEFVKIHKDKFKKNTDYIFVGKSVLKEKIKKLKYKDIEKDINKVIKWYKQGNKIMKKILLFLIKIYQKGISPYLGRRCRFYPTCSEYSKQAIIKYGAVKGSYLAIKRILKCHPFHKGGYDPLK